MKNILIIVILVIFSSCKTKEIVVTKTNTIHDTVFKEKFTTVNVPIHTVIEVPAECDSVTKQLKPFRQQIKSGAINVNVFSKNGILTATVNTDSVKQVAISDYNRTLKSDVEIQEIIITEYRVAKWCWLLLIYSILLTLYVFRKHIPYLRLLPF